MIDGPEHVETDEREGLMQRKEHASRVITALFEVFEVRPYLIGCYEQPGSPQTSVYDN